MSFKNLIAWTKAALKPKPSETAARPIEANAAESGGTEAPKTPKRS